MLEIKREPMETQRLLIRRFCLENWQDTREYLSQEEVAKYWPCDVSTEEDSKSHAM